MYIMYIMSIMHYMICVKHMPQMAHQKLRLGTAQLIKIRCETKTDKTAAETGRSGHIWTYLDSRCLEI